MIKVLCLMVLFINVSLFTAQADDEDWQSWNIVQFSWKVNKDWSGAFQNQIKLKENATTAFYRHSELGLAGY